MQEITTLISTVGFPIVACIFMFFGFKYIFDQFMTKLSDIEEQHKGEVSTLTEALQNNTIAMNMLAEKLGEELTSKNG